MTKEKLLTAMQQFDAKTLSTAYVYAKNLTLYGADVTEKWLTALEKAYRKGYYDALKQREEGEANED